MPPFWERSSSSSESDDDSSKRRKTEKPPLPSKPLATRGVVTAAELLAEAPTLPPRDPLRAKARNLMKPPVVRDARRRRQQKDELAAKQKAEEEAAKKKVAECRKKAEADRLERQKATPKKKKRRESASDADDEEDKAHTTDDDSDVSSDDDDRRKKKNKVAVQAKKRRDETDDESDEESEEEEEETRRRKKRREETDDESEEEESEEEEETRRRKKSRRKPIRRKQEDEKVVRKRMTPREQMEERLRLYDEREQEEAERNRAEATYVEDDDDVFMENAIAVDRDGNRIDPDAKKTTTTTRRKTTTTKKKSHGSDEEKEDKAKKDGVKRKTTTKRATKGRPKKKEESSSSSSDSDDGELHPTLEVAEWETELEDLKLEVPEDMLEECGEDGPRAMSVPGALKRYLGPHQIEGVQWMYRQWATRRGGILADDMGLGKTIQTIAFVAALLGLTGSVKVDKARRRRREKAAKALTDADVEAETIIVPALIVVPKPTLASWEEAFDKWTMCRVAVLSHNQKPHDVRQKILVDARRGGVDVILTTHSIIMKLDWSTGPDHYEICVVDEMHKAKGARTKFHNLLKNSVKPISTVLIGLTGTPLQNANSEGYNLLQLCTDADFGTEKEFRDTFEKVLARARRRGADREDIAVGIERHGELKELYSKYILRRTKTEVLGDKLKFGKQDLIVICPLSDLQKEMYKRVIALNDVKIFRNHNKICDCSKGRRDRLPRKKCCGKLDIVLGPLLGTKDAFFATGCLAKSSHAGGFCSKCPGCWTFNVMDKLHKLAMHPHLLLYDPDDHKAALNREKKKNNNARKKKKKNYSDDSDSDEDANNNNNNDDEAKVTKKRFDETKEDIETFAKIAFGPKYIQDHGTKTSKKFHEQSRIDECGKLTMLNDLLVKIWRERTDEFGEPHRVIIFSERTRMLDLIEAYIESCCYDYIRIDGGTGETQRLAAMKKFQDPTSNVFIGLFSTGAGGTGLNLQAANNVIIMDPSWNPASDEQAQDRAFRIGQHRRVKCYRFLSQGTIEELKWLRQLYKQKMTGAGFVEEKEFKDYGVKFKAVKGEVNGELFGMENMIKFSETSFIEEIDDPGGHKRRAKEKENELAGVVDVDELTPGIDAKINAASDKIDAELEKGVDVSKYYRREYDDDEEAEFPFDHEKPRARPAPVDDDDDDPEAAMERQLPKKKTKVSFKPPATKPPQPAPVPMDEDDDVTDEKIPPKKTTTPPKKTKEEIFNQAKDAKSTDDIFDGELEEEDDDY